MCSVPERKKVRGTIMTCCDTVKRALLIEACEGATRSCLCSSVMLKGALSLLFLQILLFFGKPVLVTLAYKSIGSCERLA
jgi:hypothetical protein